MKTLNINNFSFYILGYLLEPIIKIWKFETFSFFIVFFFFFWFGIGQNNIFQVQ
jgi:hypothetical protein